MFVRTLLVTPAASAFNFSRPGTNNIAVRKNKCKTFTLTVATALFFSCVSATFASLTVLRPACTHAWCITRHYGTVKLCGKLTSMQCIHSKRFVFDFEDFEYLLHPSVILKQPGGVTSAGLNRLNYRNKQMKEDVMNPKVHVQVGIVEVIH